LQPSKVRELSPSLGHRCERPPGLIIGCRLGSEIGGFGSSEINISCFHLVVHLTGVLFLYGADLFPVLVSHPRSVEPLDARRLHSVRH
jgi:hypothetical protein